MSLTELPEWIPPEAQAATFGVDQASHLADLTGLRALAHRAGRPLLLFDLETTGLSWWSPEFGIVEAAFLSVEANGAMAAAQFLVDPEAPMHWAAREKHCLSTKDLEQAFNWGEAFAATAASLAATHLWVGFNSANFDCPAVSGQCHRYGAGALEFPHHLDVRHAVGEGGRLEQLAERYDVRVAPTHRAADDVVAMAEILSKVVDARGAGEVLDHAAPLRVEPRARHTTMPLPSAGLELEGQPDPESAFERACFLRRLLRDAKAELDHIEPTVLAFVESQGGKLRNPQGSFTVTERKRWKYSDEVSRLGDMVKARKKLEEEEGIAVAQTPTRYLTVRLKG